MLDVPSLGRYLSRCLALAWLMGGWLLKHAARSPRGDPSNPPQVAGGVLPARGGPAAETVATVGTAMRCGLIPVTCCMLWWLLIRG